jgi:hypothetical protein
MGFITIPLGELKPRKLRIHKITTIVSSPLKLLHGAIPSQCINHHEDNLVKRCFWRRSIIEGFIMSQSREKWFIWKEATCEDQYGDWNEYIRRDEE